MSPPTHPGQLTIVTLTLSELVLQRLQSVAKTSNSTMSAVANDLLDDLLRPYTDE